MSGGGFCVMKGSAQEMAHEIAERMMEERRQTNADRIRAMTDEELAEIAAKMVDCNECKLYKYNKCMASEEACANQWLDWLRQEAVPDD